MIAARGAGGLLAAVGTVIAIAVLLALDPPAAASRAASSATAIQQVTRGGVGRVRLGMTYRAARRRGVIGRAAKGCEPAGPSSRYAPLRPPLKGTVDLTQRSPRKIAAITVTRGAAARGIGIGASLDQVEAAFPRAEVDHSSDEVFGISIVDVPRSEGGPFAFAVSTSSERVTTIGVPRLLLCD